VKDFPELPEAAVAASSGASNLAQRMRAERPRDGTTLSMISALTHLDREGPMTAGRLASLQRAKPQTLTRTLARLEERVWIARGTSDTDRRQVLIHLTEQGAARLHEDIRSRTAWLARAMERLSPTEREVLRIAGTLMTDLATWDDVEDAP
jgi:DNA-binding MarR family transcriptional regulator